MNAGSEFGCTAFVGQGSVPNEHGTWYYGRDGWCDGQDVKPLVWDITSALALDHDDPQQTPTSGRKGRAQEFNLTYFALAYDVGGKHPSEDGCDGGILMTANVAFYDD